MTDVLFVFDSIVLLNPAILLVRRNTSSALSLASSIVRVYIVKPTYLYKDWDNEVRCGISTHPNFAAKKLNEVLFIIHYQYTFYLRKQYGN